MKPGHERGYAMAALLVGLSVMSIVLSMALPVWRTAVKREREAELVFRGEQYARAIELFSRRNGGSYPPSFEVLEEGRYIRKLYKDPMTGEGDFQPVYFGQVPPGQTSVPVLPGGGGPGGEQIGMPLTPSAPAGRAGQPPGASGQPGTIGAGPIIGVVSRSTAESLRLYNGHDRYNEWAFMALVATPQAGALGGQQNPGLGQQGVPGRGGRGAGQGAPGRGGRGDGLGAPGRGGQRIQRGRGQNGGRGQAPPGRGFQGPGGAGPGNPSGFQGGFPFPGGRQRGPSAGP